MVLKLWWPPFSLELLLHLKPKHQFGLCSGYTPFELFCSDFSISSENTLFEIQSLCKVLIQTQACSLPVLEGVILVDERPKKKKKAGQCGLGREGCVGGKGGDVCVGNECVFLWGYGVGVCVFWLRD